MAGLLLPVAFAFTAPSNVNTTVSSGSYSVSLITCTLKTWPVMPGVNISVPVAVT